MSEKRYLEYLDYAIGLGILVELTLGGLILAYLVKDTPIGASLIGGYWTNIISTVIGAVLTIVILDKRNENRAIKQRKEELILQMGSPDNGFAVEAVRLLKQKGWLKDGSLQRADLREANLQEADLREANLQETYLFGANLQQADLREANLQGAFLREANLQGATLWRADLQGADLFGANLQKAFLSEANLQGATLFLANLQQADLREANLRMATLWRANLQQADLREVNLRMAFLLEANLQQAGLRGAIFSPETPLPDGTHWTPDRDLREFTHPEIWKAEQSNDSTTEQPPQRVDIVIERSKPRHRQRW